MHSQNTLLDKLEQDVRQMMQEARTLLAEASDQSVTQRKNEKSWNALECLAHLNSYSDYYIPKFERAIHKSKARKHLPAEEVSSSLLGRYCIRSIHPDTRSRKGMRTPKKHNHIHKSLDRSVIKAFIINQEMLLRTIQKSREVNINKAKVGFQPFPILKLSLTEFLQFFVAHEERHMLQALNAMKNSTKMAHV